MKYLIPLISALLLLRYLSSKAKIPDNSGVPSEWLVKPSGWFYWDPPDQFFNIGEKNCFQWSQKAMLWGIEFKLDPALILGCMYSESAGNPNAKRWEANRNEYSFGLMQVLWSTAKEIVGWLKIEGLIPSEFVLTADNIMNPNLNIMLGARYLSSKIAKYRYIGGKTMIEYMFSAYNAGSVPASGIYVNPDYVKKCMNASQKFRYYLNNTYPAYLTMFPKTIWQYSGI